MLELQYYVDRPATPTQPGRDLTICEPGAVAWCDLEPGCFESAQDVRDFGTLVTGMGLRYGTYGNRWSISAVMGASTELAAWPLWYADYRPPDFATFEPFNGWTTPDLWQYFSDGYCGVNADLSITPDGRLFADISNYSTLTLKQANYFKFTLDGVVIGLQDAGKARHFKELLT